MSESQCEASVGENVELGRGCIWAEVVADSISINNDRLTTFRLHYPRFIHSEVMTHRMFSRNASSSRAIPVRTMLEGIMANPAKPIHWGANQPGMQAEVESDNLVTDELGHSHNKEDYWDEMAQQACQYADNLAQAGYHKQIVNRLTEPFQFMNVVLTGTDFDNFFWLRCHLNTFQHRMSISSPHLPFVSLEANPNEAFLHQI